jgi:hypothetical protein
MKNLILAAALACTAGTAMGSDIFAFNMNNMPAGSGGSYSARDASGVFGARMAVFSTAGGAFFDDASGPAGPNLHNFGLTESMGLSVFGNNILISSTQTILPNGNQQIVFSVFTETGVAFVPVGATVGGATINAIQFDIGTPNAPADPVDFVSPITVVSATFSIFTTAATSFGPFASTTTTPGGNSLTVRSGVSAGTDITGFGINRMDVTVEVTKIPAPASLALLGLGGLVATRRRR